MFAQLAGAVTFSPPPVPAGTTLPAERSFPDASMAMAGGTLPEQAMPLNEHEQEARGRVARARVVRAIRRFPRSGGGRYKVRQPAVRGAPAVRAQGRSASRPCRFRCYQPAVCNLRRKRGHSRPCSAF